MKLATILPRPDLDRTPDGTFYMSLAQVAADDPHYLNWFRRRAEEPGNFVLLDNGAAEIGEGLDLATLARVAARMNPQEVVLPDVVGDTAATIERGLHALASNSLDAYRLMAVPQGSTPEEWLECLAVMNAWPVESIGISRFVVNNGLFPDRSEAITAAGDLLDGFDVHLLGCPADPVEIFRTGTDHPRVRSADSGIAAIYAQAGLALAHGVPKPDAPLDFDRDAGDPQLLTANVTAWLSRAGEGSWR